MNGTKREIKYTRIQPTRTTRLFFFVFIFVRPVFVALFFSRFLQEAILVSILHWPSSALPPRFPQVYSRALQYLYFP